MSSELRALIVERDLGQINAAKMPPELRRHIERSDLWSIHPGKLSAELKRFLGYRQEYEGDWLIVDSQFSDAYMAALAAMLAEANDLSPLTSIELCQGLNIRSLIEDEPEKAAADAKGAIVTIVMEALRIDPEVPIQKLIAFRRSRATQLAELSGVFDDLKVQIGKSESKAELREKANRLFQNKVRPGIEKLKTELEGQTIHGVWKGISRAATVSVAAGSVLATFTGWSTPMLLGAGAFLAATDISFETFFSRRKARQSTPYSYLLDVENKFSQSRWVTAA
jgi:hypothetical protein